MRWRGLVTNEANEMKFKTLQKIADKDSISMSVDSNSAIVSVQFTINDAKLRGQFDPDNVGIFAIYISGSELLTMLGLDADGNAVFTDSGE